VDQDQFDRYLSDVRLALNDSRVELQGELWDGGEKVRMTAAWPGGRWAVAREWRAAALPRAADVAGRIAARIRDASTPDDLTEAERRAFIFGPWIERMANERFGGSAEAALRSLSSPERAAQHLRDLAGVRPKHREAYNLLMRAAGGTDAEWPS